MEKTIKEKRERKEGEERSNIERERNKEQVYEGRPISGSDAPFSARRLVPPTACCGQCAPAPSQLEAAFWPTLTRARPQSSIPEGRPSRLASLDPPPLAALPSASAARAPSASAPAPSRRESNLTPGHPSHCHHLRVLIIQPEAPNIVIVGNTLQREQPEGRFLGAMAAVAESAVLVVDGPNEWVHGGAAQESCRSISSASPSRAYKHRTRDAGRAARMHRAPAGGKFASRELDQTVWCAPGNHTHMRIRARALSRLCSFFVGSGGCRRLRFYATRESVSSSGRSGWLGWVLRGHARAADGGELRDSTGGASVSAPPMDEAVGAKDRRRDNVIATTTRIATNARKRGQNKKTEPDNSATMGMRREISTALGSIYDGRGRPAHVCVLGPRNPTQKRRTPNACQREERKKSNENSPLNSAQNPPDLKMEPDSTGQRYTESHSVYHQYWGIRTREYPRPPLMSGPLLL
ncbi:hypothetical protein DFH07DRAFT_936020 [Mycena maculata]|uniref:Uncharacterized protein n=1 Tax=Mycena maculata TaxID=230809 RepID=A0AAD7K7Y4_9AGAR|nr:hypothetical protein DFH07DRAFT_936020 [Mycena maculata]